MKRAKSKILIILFLTITNLLQAQDKIALKYSAYLDSSKMKATITKLASDDFMGRKSSDEGIRMSADYLIGQLTSYKIKGGNNDSYKQNIEAFNKTKSDKYFTVADFNYADSYTYNNAAYQDSVIKGKDIVFAGYGIHHSSFNDFSTVDITDKIVLLLDGDGPVNKYGVKLHNAPVVPSRDFISSQKPRAVLMVDPGFKTYSNYSSNSIQFFSKQNGDIYPVIKINELLANRILGPTNKSVKQLLYESEDNSSSLAFSFENELTFNGNNSYKLADLNNIIAIIEGTDLKDEYIILSAHYDHIGTSYSGKVFNGADDNASGVSAVLEIARVLTIAKKEGNGPRRSVVVLFTTAEEDGLKGSEYYVSNPVFPLEKTKLCLNIDMLGRIASKADSADIAKGYVYALTGNYRANDSLFAVIDSINLLTTNLSIPLSYSSLYSRSDHYEFYENKIPSVLFTNGEHEDLHAVTDDVEKIDFKALLKRSKLAFLTLWEFANNPNPFKEIKTDKIKH